MPESRRRRKPPAKPVADPKPKRRGGINPCTSEPDYSADEVAFNLAMERYRRLNGRPFPTGREVLQVLYALGYRKTAAPTPLPGHDAKQAQRTDS